MSEAKNTGASSTMAGEPLVLLLWGNTQVGKTSLVVTGLLHDYSRFNNIDWAKSGASTEATLRENKRRLYFNLPPIATSSEGSRTEVVFASGRRLIIQDVRGGLSARPEQAEVREMLDAAHAILFVMEWGGRDRPRQLEAVSAVLPHLRGRPAALAFTKCEAVFDLGAPEWQLDASEIPRSGWWKGWREDPFTLEEQRVLSRLELVWPTSVYGYNRNGQPACLLDEFGELIPYHMNPKNVIELFQWFFNRLGL